jgi:hypothetical protein
MSPRPLTQIKHFTDGLVVRWVTTSESPLLYVFDFFGIYIFAPSLEWPWFIVQEFSVFETFSCAYFTPATEFITLF